MKQVLHRKGEIIVEEVPVPIVRDNNVLVQVAYSCISTGTEISGVTSSGESLLQRALKEPDKVDFFFVYAFSNQVLICLRGVSK